MECVLNRPALGNTACLGDLYDARTDRFCNMSILSRALPDQVIQCTESPFVDLKFIYSEAVREKFEKLDIKGSISLSILAGLVPLEGSGKYLQQDQQTEQAVRSSLLYSVGTKVETLNVHHEDFLECTSARALADQEGLTACGATHVVTRIDWGAKVMVTLESAVKGKQHVDEIKLGLKATLDKLAGTVKTVSVSGSLDGDGKSLEKQTQFSLRIFGDILPKRDGTSSSEIPQNYEEALRFLRSVPALVQESNNGKGKPIGYGLVPLSMLQKQVGITDLLNPRCVEPSAPFVTKFMHIFSQLTEIKQELSMLTAKVAEYERHIPRQYLSELSKFRQSFEESENELKHELKGLLLHVRSGKQEEVNALSELVEKTSLIQHANTFLGLDHDGDINKSFAPILLQKIQRVEAFNARGIHCISRNEQLEGTVLEQPEAYVLISGSGGESGDGHDSKWSETKQYFYELMGNYTIRTSEAGSAGQCFFFLDPDLGRITSGVSNTLSTQTQRESVIQYYKKGKCELEDVYGDYCKRLAIPIVGTYELVNNGNFGEYLTAIGVGGLQWYAVTKSWLTIVITEKDGRYHLDMQATAGPGELSFILDKEFGDQTTDGCAATNLVTRDVNKLIHTQTLHNPERSVRITTREFTEHEMIVKLEANGVTATRTFKRIK